MLSALTTSDKINAVLLFVTALGVTAAFWQLRAAARAQRAIFLKDLYLQLRTDPDVAHAYYLIEYDNFVYDEGFHGSELEPKLDRLLTVIDLVCEMHLQNVISKREMQFFHYQFRRVAQNAGVRSYLRFLNGIYAQSKLDHKPFCSFQAHSREDLAREYAA